MAASLADVPYEAQPHLIAGVHWGGGAHSRTVLVIGYMRRDFVFQICGGRALLRVRIPNEF